MSRPTAKLSRLTVGALLILAVGGCQWSTWDVHDMAAFHTHKPKPPIADHSELDMGLQIATASQAARDQALSETMREVRQLGDTNPAAQQKLLEELAASKPDLWPLAVQQFRSTLAYHEQLVAAAHPTTQLASTRGTTTAVPAPQRWPGNPPSDIQANYEPPPAEMLGPPAIKQTALITPAPSATTPPSPPPSAENKEPVELPDEEAVEKSEPLALLRLSQLTFCKTVYGFGSYEPYDADRFSPGQQVSLYVEIANFHSESTEDGFATKLGATYQLLDERGERVDGGEFPNVEDCCRSRRRDFHIQYGLVMPESIPPGKYQLRLAMRDLKSDQVGQAMIGFEIDDREP